MIELDAVTVRHDVPRDSALVSRLVLDALNLTLSESRVAVIGANGSGKSTLLRVLNGLTLPTSGSVRVDGLDTRTDGPAVRQRVGFVFTDPAAQLVMATPADDVALSLRRSIADRHQRRAAALSILADQGLAELADSSVHDLSGGERQLVALAGVLALDPHIIVADEPTTLLDLRNRDRLWSALWQAPQQLIYATHDLDFASAADRCLVLAGGRVVADGAPEQAIGAYRELMSAPGYLEAR